MTRRVFPAVPNRARQCVWLGLAILLSWSSSRLLVGEDSLVVAYALSEATGTTTADASGNGITATLTNGPTWTASGRYGAGLIFDGGNDSVQVPASTALDLTTAFTLEGWVNPTSSTSGVLLHRPEASGLGTTYSLQASGSVFARAKTTAATVTVYGPAIPTGQWTHVASTWDGATLRLYIDGALSASAALNGTLVSSTGQPLSIGGLSGHMFNGRLDEIRVYSRALSASELTRDMYAALDTSAPPVVAGFTPASGATGLPLTVTPSAIFSKAMTGSTITSNTVVLRNAQTQAIIPATVTYDAASHAATVTPTGALAALTTYRVTILGGTAGVLDGTGVGLDTDVTWTFRTAPEVTWPQLAYAFNEASGTSAADMSGNTTAATLHSGASFTTDGRHGGAVSFNGTNTANVLDSAPLDLTTAFTIEAWMYRTGATGVGTILTRPKSDGHGTAYGLTLSSTGTLVARATSSAGTVTLSGGAIPVQQWTHVAATWDGATLRTYINGTLDQSTALTGTLVSSGTFPAWIGGVSGARLDGRLDDLRLYHRALSAAEIAADMNTPVNAEAPTVAARTPANSSTGIALTVHPTVTFTVDMTTTSVTADTVVLRDEATQTVLSATVTYNGTARTATLTPISPLATLTTYQVTVTGGAVGVLSATGLTMASDVSWTFHTAPSESLPQLAYAFSEGIGTVTGDLSGNGIVATLVQGTMWTESGRFGSALVFDGTDDAVEIPPSAALDFTSGFTVEAWVYPTTAMPVGTLLRRGSGQGDVIRLALGSVDAQATANTVAQVSSAMTLPINQWSYVSVTWDGSVLRLFVDGMLKAEAPLLGALLTSTEPLWIGGGTFTGRIDEVRIYQRALAAADISVDMASPIDGSTPSPVCTYAVSPPSVTVSSAPTTVTVQVVTANGCPWEVGAGDSWVTLPDGTAGSGTTLVTLAISENVAVGARSTTVTLGGRTIAITQASPFDGVDSSGPVIRPTYLPKPNQAGWNNTPVQVSFACSDRSGVSSCPAPISFTSEGASQSALVTATDTAGNVTGLVVAVNIDLTPPAVAVINPDEEITVVATSFGVVASVTDDLSGVNGATCNGSVAAPVGNTLSCTIFLRKGLNAFVVQARDVAGNISSAGGRLRRRAAPTTFEVTPSRYTLVPGESVQLVVRDDFDAPITVTWSTQNQGVATVDVDGRVTAVAAGQTTVSATLNALEKDIQVTVVGAADLTSGITRWVAKPLDGYANWSAVGVKGPRSTAFASVELASGGVVAIRAFSLGGQPTYSVTAGLPPGEELRQVVGDATSGVLLVSEVAAPPGSPDNRTSITKVSALDAQENWQYNARRLRGLAQAPDGTVFTIEDSHQLDNAIIGLDGSTGRRKFHIPTALTRNASRYPACPNEDDYENWTNGLTIGDIVIDANGVANVLVLQNDVVDWHFATPFSCWGDVWLSRRVKILLYRVESSGQYEVVPLADYSYYITATWPVYPTEQVWEFVREGDQRYSGKLLPDDEGGVLALWRRCDMLGTQQLADVSIDNCQSRLRHVTASGQSPEYFFALDPAETPVVSGQGSIAYRGGTSIVAFNMSNGSPLWTAPFSGTPGAALDDGGLALTSGGEVTILDSGGGMVAAGLGGGTGLLPAMTAGDVWFGLVADSTLSGIGATVAADAAVSPVGFALQSGNRLGGNAPAPWYGNPETAALAALDFIYPITQVTGWEYGGLICRQSQQDRYVWTPFVTSEDAGRVDIEGRVSCARIGTRVARYHTHPFGGEVFPSGFVNPTLPNDIANANASPDVVFYLKSPNPSAGTYATHEIKYQKAQGVTTARNNVFELSGDYLGTYEWVLVPPP